jgi:IPT/TIG domain
MYAGGAVMIDIGVEGTSFIFNNSVFSSNTADVAGGAVFWRRQATDATVCSATATDLTFPDTIFSNNIATQWGNTIASDTCNIAFAVAMPSTVESGSALMDITDSAAPLLQALDYYGNVVLSESSLTINIALPASNPVTSSYNWLLNTFTVASGSVSLYNIILRAQPTSAFTFTVTASDTQRSFSVSYTLNTKACQPGHYRELSTSDDTLYTCASCSSGTYNTAIEAITCRTCSANYYCPVGSAQQTLCPTRYKSTAGSSACVCDVQYVGVQSVTGCSNSSSLVNGTVDCPTDASAILTVSGENFGTGVLSISVGGRECIIQEAYMDTSVLLDANSTTCIPPKGYAYCKLPAGTGKLQFVTVSDITGTTSQQVSAAL